LTRARDVTLSEAERARLADVMASLEDLEEGALREPGAPTVNRDA
jgi:hypothetical protein